MNNIGLHLRYYKSFDEIIDQILDLDLRIFQCFLTYNNSRQYIECNQELILKFKKIREKIDSCFVHGSYYINLAYPNSSQPLLDKEIIIAKKLNFSAIVLHTGSFTEDLDHIRAIDIVVKNLNKFFFMYPDFNIILENCSYSNNVIGGNLEDFSLIKSKIDKPEMLKFCIDTAHALTYGYDISNLGGVESFLNQIDSLLGFSNISLIHLNDTKENLGSKIDSHCMLGQGKIGLQNLKKIVTNQNFKNIPVILELSEYKDIQKKIYSESIDIIKNMFKNY